MAIYTLRIWDKPNAQQLAFDISDNVANVVSKNELSYNASPTRSNDMMLHNDQEAYYVPTVEFTLNDLEPEKFRTLMQIINSRGFIVQYYDTELGVLVFRSVYATEQSVEALLHTGGNLDGFNGVKVKFVSRYGYPYTPRNSDNYSGNNKYHMYELYAHCSSVANMLPSSHSIEEEDYV